MARSGSRGFMAAVARETARRQREEQRARRRQLREAEQAARELERQRALAPKEAQRRHLEERQQQVEDLNRELNERIHQLQQILAATLAVDDTISFASLRVKAEIPPFSPPPRPPAPFELPRKPGLLARLLDGEQRYREALAAYQAAVAESSARWEAEIDQPDLPSKPNPLTRWLLGERRYREQVAAYEAARAAWEARREARWEAEVERLREEHRAAAEALRRKEEQRNREVDEFEAAYHAGEPDAIVTYVSMVLERSEYPEGFPQKFRVAFVPESRELVIDYELPTPDIVPKVAEYSYVKSRDVIQEKPRKPSEIKELYQDIVASVALRTLHEVIESDQGNHIQTVTFSGYIQMVDPATGHDTQTYLISARVAKERFAELDLSRVNKLVCLRNLGAQVSPQPTELRPVRPIVEFDMVDRRFVDQQDVIAELDARPNLFDLSPTEFEHLVSNLFQRMGLETRLTRASKDGGVDAVVFDHRPVLGGKVVIQAKRYRNPVDVSAVRDLYGTMLNEGASKGILVTTSGFGAAAFEFAKDKPIELIDGSGLLYLLEQHGIKARIIFPVER